MFGNDRYSLKKTKVLSSQHFTFPYSNTASVVTVTTTEDMADQPQEAVSSSEEWQALSHPQLAHLPQLPHPLRRRMQVSPPRQPPPPPPVAVELEVATTDMWCHT